MLTKLLKQVFSGKKMLRSLLFVGVPALLFYGFSIIIMRSGGFETLEIIRDPAQQSELSSFLGFLSNIGIWLWISSTAISFFAAFQLPESRQKELLLLVGALSMTLAVDDFFMIHDRYLHELICYLGYAILLVMLLARHYKKILEIDAFAFLSAGALLAMSIVTDVTQGYNPFYYDTVQIVEEGFKFVGASIWLRFACCVAAYRPSEHEAL